MYAFGFDSPILNLFSYPQRGCKKTCVFYRGLQKPPIFFWRFPRKPPKNTRTTPPTAAGPSCRKADALPTSCVLTSQNTDGEKFLCRNFSLSGSIKTVIHAPGFYEFAAQILFNTRFRANTCAVLSSENREKVCAPLKSA